MDFLCVVEDDDTSVIFQATVTRSGIRSFTIMIAAIKRRRIITLFVLLLLVIVVADEEAAKALDEQVVRLDNTKEEGECVDGAAVDGSCTSPYNIKDTDHIMISSPRNDENAGDELDTIEAIADCKDNDARCSQWAAVGECDNNPEYMLSDCQVSCNNCSPTALKFTDEENQLLQQISIYGQPQRVERSRHKDDIFNIINQTIRYMKNDIYGQNATHTLTDILLAECTNNEDLCAFWAVIGECEVNPSYMKTKCAPSCQTCDLIDMDNRCPKLDDNVRPALLPGELNAMFERIVTTPPYELALVPTVQRLIDPIDGTTDNNTTDHAKYGEMTNYRVIVHSRPNPDSNDGNEGRDTWSTARNRRMSNNDDEDEEDDDDTRTNPWVITFDNFLTIEECKHLINLGYKSDYERSEDVGDLKPDGTFDSVQSDTRTSENAWCSDKNNCRTDLIVRSIHDRIARVTGIPAVNSEDLQLLKYEMGQFYRQHHDYIEFQRDRRCGPRILTFFLYLSDVEEGGGTHFPILNITVYPKAGRALLWPSILDNSPLDKDPVTDHEAQDVIKGLKFGANAWLHTYDYMDASRLGCT